jgi:vacuolar-type H+-ATPase subunit E/Vma4
MALEELRRRIEQDARAAAAKLEKEGDDEAKRMLDEARERAGKAKRAARERAQAEAEQRFNEMLTALETESGSILSAAREECVERELRPFRAAVRRKLQAREHDIIRSALKSFSAIMPLEQSFVKVDKRNAALAEGAARIEYEDGMHGIVLASPNRRVTVDATIDGIMASNADSIRRILAKGMFG